jgi:hypothetical protein
MIVSKGSARGEIERVQLRHRSSERSHERRINTGQSSKMEMLHRGLERGRDEIVFRGGFGEETNACSGDVRATGEVERSEAGAVIGEDAKGRIRDTAKGFEIEPFELGRDGKEMVQRVCREGSAALEVEFGKECEALAR